MNFVALKMLLFDKNKFFGLIFTIAIATFLMAQQLSIFIAAMNRTGSQIMDIREANVWVMDPNVEYFEEIKPLRDIDLIRVRGVTGVQWALPLFKGLAAITGQGLTLHQAFLFGVDDTALIGRPRVLIGEWEDLRKPHTLIIDRAGWDLIFDNADFQLGQNFQINNQKMTTVGLADPSAPFFAFPLIYTRYSEAMRLARQGNSSLSFVLVKTAPGFSAESVAKNIEQQTGLQALTSSQFKWRSINYVLQNTPIPINFGLTVSLGFLIGIVVVGQTFYLFLLENMPQFGLLKAIGVTNKQILSMVLLQAIWIAWIGFGFGIGLCAIFSEVTARIFINLRGVYVPWQVIVGTGLCVAIIILIACLTGVRKVFLLEPAVVFRG